MPKKTLFQKVRDYAEKLLSICPNQSSVETEEMEDGVIKLTTHYHDREDNIVEIANKRELSALKREDKKQMALGYLV